MGVQQQEVGQQLAVSQQFLGKPNVSVESYFRQFSADNKMKNYNIRKMVLILQYFILISMKSCLKYDKINKYDNKFLQYIVLERFS